MKTTTLAAALAAALAQASLAQNAATKPPRPSAPRAVAAAPKVDEKVSKTGITPELTDVNQAPSFTLPTEPIDPLLVQRHNGPFMVAAKTFRGPDAARYAQALAMELRQVEKLPAYIFRMKVKPGNSNQYGQAPTAPKGTPNRDLTAPERFRTNDEAIVLVGDCKTIEEARDLLKRVKHIHPACLDGMPSVYFWRNGQGLKQAFQTTNPLAGSQDLFPGREMAAPPGAEKTFNTYEVVARMQRNSPAKVDKLVADMNRPLPGSKSLYNCPGPYTVQVAEFSGGTVNALGGDLRELTLVGATAGSNSAGLNLKKSVLATAHDDAEGLADAIGRSKSFPKGMSVYVYHDRTTSRVMVGAFRGADDPSLAILKGQIDKISNELIFGRKTGLALQPQLVLLGTPEGLQIHDSQIQRASIKSGQTFIPPSPIPMPGR